jgi:type VI secretion system protein ImpA
MPSAPVLDVESLLAPLTGPKPEGKRLPSFDPKENALDQKKIKEYRETVDPESEKKDAERIAIENYSGPEREEFLKMEMSRIGSLKAKKPQWEKIIQEGSTYLKESGKDLQLAIMMIEALTMKNKFAGTRDGIKLVRRLCEECWDVMHPVIDDPDNAEDVDMRVAIFSFLEEEEKSPFFPNTIRATPLLSSSEKQISVLACRPPKSGSFKQDSEIAVTNEELQNAINYATDQQLAQIGELVADCNEAIEELNTLVQVLDEKIGKKFEPEVRAPSLAKTRDALSDCLTMMQGILNQRSGSEDGNSDSNGGTSDNGSSGGGSAGGTALNAVRTRSDIYARLRELANLLQQMDPQSAVPPLVHR